MPLLFMDSGCEPQNLDSLSADECSSNTSGLEREGEEQQMGPRVSKRREKNRDAARKSRKKQTERADELHQELQCLEQSNSTLQKEIAALKKDLQFYETALERHKPYCRLRSSASRSSTCPSVSSLAKHQGSSSPPRASNSTPTSRAKSVSPSIASQILNCTKETNLSPSTSALMTTTVVSSAASSAKVSSSSASSSSSPSTFPYSVSFSSHTAPHSLFSQLPLTTSRSTNVPPSCASLVSNPAPSADAKHQPEKILQNKTSSLSQSSYFPGNAFSSASHNLQASLSPLEAENTSVTEQCPAMNSPQLHPYQLSGNPNNSRPPCALLPSPLPDPASQTLSTLPHVCLEPPPTLPLSLRQSYNQQVSTSSVSILSLLTVPSPLNVTQSTSSSTDEPLTQPLPSLPPPSPQLDPFKDLSLSEFLERNDWILNGISDE
ncbi:flocculation protein FLO11 [Melanotaenia boesemani]|uniref:flocculation protein FLO11 n=1 Tax=Melanotaenia boesemani TaxID=1250792 RepID=UPI001C0531C8|nr:flocculation protein FLO11 [Melanotaenia boesemani]